uniref:Uncharacterized protein n=1 Tax=Rhizophora mucronata TaxID=61149 RepID=A0A2P2N427_RHIMU
MYSITVVYGFAFKNVLQLFSGIENNETMETRKCILFFIQRIIMRLPTLE